MVVVGASMYVAAFLFNILATVLADDGIVGHNISYVFDCRRDCALDRLRSRPQLPGRRQRIHGRALQPHAGGRQERRPRPSIQRLQRLPEPTRQQSIHRATDRHSPGEQYFRQSDPGAHGAVLRSRRVATDHSPPGESGLPSLREALRKATKSAGKILTEYCVAVVTMFWTGAYEVIRRSAGPLTYAGLNGETQLLLDDDGGEVMNEIPWRTAIPHYVLTAIPSFDLNYSEVPQSMHSTSVALGFFVNPMGRSLFSILVLLFGKFIPADLNDGHREYLFFTLGALMVVNILAYVVVVNQMQFGMHSRQSKEVDTPARSSV